MKKPVLSVEFWRRRLELAPAGQRHRAVYECAPDLWARIEVAHRAILARHVGPEDSVLDAGCGWGRLLDLLPPEWHGRYLGVDLSPDFVRLAKEERPHRDFRVCDLRGLGEFVPKWDWAVMISIRGMVKRELGEDAWTAMEAGLRRAASRLLYLEYDPDDPGSVE